MALPEIIKESERAMSYLPELIAATNAHTAELGFLSQNVYQEAIASEQIWILADDAGYGGHVFFCGRFPTLRVQQLFIMQRLRGHGYARKLMDELVNHAELQGYFSMRARVAAELPANAAWEQLGFQTQSVQPARTPNRMINIRHRLVQPRGPQTTMLGAFAEVPPPRTPLIARGMPLNREHWYTIDICVWLDFARQRAPFFESARALIEDASRGRFRLRFTPEALEEARRNASGRTVDPLHQIALQWQTVPEDDDDAVRALVEQLRPIVFPDRSASGRTAANDVSDLRHLALSICAGAYGFITRENALLRARGEIWRCFRLEVLRPGDLLDDGGVREAPVTTDAGIEIMPISHEWAKSTQFVRSMMTSGDRLRQLDREDVGWYCIAEQTIVGVTFWRNPSRGDIEVFLGIRPDDGGEDVRQRVFDLLMGLVISEARTRGALHRLLLRTDLETAQRHVRDLASIGFFGSPEVDRFVRFVSGAPIELKTWAQAQDVVDSELGVTSTWADAGDLVLELDSSLGRVQFDLFEFETRFGVSGLTIGRTRRAVLIPIKETFANQLLPRPPRPELFLNHDASFRAERVYFRKDKPPGAVARGDILLFYVGNPIQRVIGAARCTVSEVLTANEAESRFRRLAVLDPHVVGEKVQCIAFDNYMHFPQHVSLTWLRENGCYPAQGMQTISPLPPTCDLCRIFELGLDHG